MKTINGIVLYNVEDIAEFLDVQTITIRRYFKEGKIRGQKIARRWYCSEENLKIFANQYSNVVTSQKQLNI